MPNVELSRPLQSQKNPLRALGWPLLLQGGGLNVLLNSATEAAVGCMPYIGNLTADADPMKQGTPAPGTLTGLRFSDRWCLLGQAELLSDLLALVCGSRAVEAVVAHAMLAFDRHVPEHAGQELRLGERQGLLVIVVMIAVAKGHALRRGRHDSVILDGTTTQIAREVVRDPMTMAIGALDADIPGLARDRSQDLCPTIRRPVRWQAKRTGGVSVIEPGEPFAAKLGFDHPDGE